VDRNVVPDRDGAGLLTAGWIPPPPPSDNQAAVAAMHREHAAAIRFCSLLMMLAGTLTLPLGPSSPFASGTSRARHPRWRGFNWAQPRSERCCSWCLPTSGRRQHIGGLIAIYVV
jgi:hypothetical protein